VMKAEDVLVPNPGRGELSRKRRLGSPGSSAGCLLTCIRPACFPGNVITFSRERGILHWTGTPPASSSMDPHLS